MGGRKATKNLEHPPRRRGKDAELAVERLDWVLDLLPLAYPETTLQRKVSEKYEIGTRQARRYIAAARKEIRDHNELTRPERRARLRQTIQMFMRKAHEVADYATGIRGCHELALLDGLNEPDQVVVSLGEGASVAPSPERLEDLRAKQAAKEPT